jgi:hypothetical protein
LEHKEEQWHYEGGRRDLRLDWLRGFAAFAMIADHIGGEESWLYPITGGNRFFVSAAEAFVFISGVVMGIVYLKVVIRQGVGAGVRKALGRAKDLYILTVLLTLAFAALGASFDFWWAPDTAARGVEGFVFDVVTLHRTLFLVDIPLMYTLLLVGACPVIFLLAKGFTPVVLAGTTGVWLAWQVSPGVPTFPWTIENNTVFHIPAWQFLFVVGIVAGWHRATLERWFGNLRQPAVSWALVAVSATVLALYVAQITMLDSLQNTAALQGLFFSKDDVPVGRVFVFFLLAMTAFSLTTVFWQPIKRWTGWLLLPLGQNALTAYSLHIFVVAAMTKITLTYWPEGAPTFTSTLMQTVGVMLVWGVVVLEPWIKVHMAARLRTPAEPLQVQGENRAQA